MGSLQAATIARESLERGTRKHCESVARKKVTTGLDAAIQLLHPAPVDRQTLIDLFDGRASYAAIRAWRYGWRTAPTWAAGVLKWKLGMRAAQMLAANVPERSKSRGAAGTKALAAWRERKARERDEKEKAANDSTQSK